MGTEQKGDVQRHVGNGEDRLETGCQVRERELLVTLGVTLGSRCWGITEGDSGAERLGLFGVSCVWGVLGMGAPEGSWTHMSGLKLGVETVLGEESEDGGDESGRGCVGTGWTSCQDRWHKQVTCQV